MMFELNICFKITIVYKKLLFRKVCHNYSYEKFFKIQRVVVVIKFDKNFKLENNIKLVNIYDSNKYLKIIKQHFDVLQFS